MSSKFSGKCKIGFLRNFKKSWKNLERQQQKFIRSTRPFFPLTPFISGLLCFKFHGDLAGVTILNILDITRALLLNFCIANTPRCQILIWGAKYFACFSRFLPVKKLFWKMDCVEKSNPSPPLTPVLSPLLFGCV